MSVRGLPSSYIHRTQALPVGTRVRVLDAFENNSRYVDTEAVILLVEGKSTHRYYEVEYYDGRHDVVYPTWVKAIDSDSVEVEE